MTPLPVAVIGCGAVAELFHAPALRALELAGRVEVAVLVDRDGRRREKLAEIFPRAKSQAELPGRADAALAIVATPARWHAEHAIALLSAGMGVLCEKPMAASTAEASAMIDSAQRTGAVLAVGLMRRFFPALQMIEGFCAAQTFGRARSFDVQEGGPFNWPAATPSFFDKAQAGGGVLLDVGVHVLDVLGWWWGEAVEVNYADDAEGGVEANCRLRLGLGAGETRVDGAVWLSRDWRTANRWEIEFERATVVWRAGEANRLEVRQRGSSRWLVSEIADGTGAARATADSVAQAFTRQLLDVVEAVEHARAPRVTGPAGLRGLRIIERCYRERGPLAAD